MPQAQLKIPDVETYDELPANHRAFVDYYLKTGDATAAAYDAGYREPKSDKSFNASLKQKGRVLRAGLAHIIDAELLSYARGTDMTLLGINVLKQLAQSAESETVRLNAAKEIVNRNVEPQAQKKEVTHKVQVSNMTDEEIDKRIAKLQGELTGNIIDVTPEEVTTT